MAGPRGTDRPPLNARRLPLLALGIVALVTAMLGGLVRMGWALPPAFYTPAALHGPLMVSGFLGTLISLERAVALRRSWAYVPPVLSGAGGVALLAGLPEPVGQFLMAQGSVGLVVVFGAIVLIRPALFTAAMALGAVSWSAGNLLWLAGWPVHAVVPWWAGFLVLTIAGERLELARLVQLPAASRGAFVLTVLLFMLALVVSAADLDAGMRLAGGALTALTVWLLHHDIARRTVRVPGLTRYIALCLLSGYIWLGAGGLLALHFGGVTAGPAYDAILHSVFLGFVMAMIFGHAPVIFPAVIGGAVAYRPAFYIHLALLHGSLVLRVAGDMAEDYTLRMWAGVLNMAAVVLFLGNSVTAGFK